MSGKDLSLSEAFKVVMDSATPVGTETLGLTELYNRFAARDVPALENVPPFDNSAMDGYGVHAADTSGASRDDPVELDVVGEVPAGHAFEGTVEKGQAVRILTGAPVPEGVDAIVRQEYVRLEGGRIVLAAPVAPHKDYRFAGEDVRAGEVAVKKGRRLTPAHVGLLTSVGVTEVEVGVRPRVSIITTGDELVEPGEELRPGKIRASNAYSLAGVIEEAGGRLVERVRAEDTVEGISAALSSAVGKSDVILTTGGISVGDYDHVREAVGRAGGRAVSVRVKVRPGSPLSLFKIGGTLHFALPGNPAASMLMFELFVRPAIMKMQGAVKLERPLVEARLTGKIRKKPGNHHLVRTILRIRDGKFTAEPLSGQGSGMLGSLAASNGIAVVEPDNTSLDEGDVVRVLMTRTPEEYEC